MTHQALQHLERYSGIQHVHGVGVTKRVRRHRSGERYSIGSSRFYRFIQPGSDSPVGDLPDTCLFGSACLLVFSFQEYLQRGHHHLQLADILHIGKGNQTVFLTAGRRTSGCTCSPFRPLFKVGQLYKRVGG